METASSFFVMGIMMKKVNGNFIVRISLHRYLFFRGGGKAETPHSLFQHLDIHRLG